MSMAATPSRKRSNPLMWAAPAVLLLACVVGVLVSVISTRDHVRYRLLGSTDAGACAAISESGCKAAHSSEAAELLGVPISHLGTTFYVACASLAVLRLIRRRRPTGVHSDAATAPVVSLLGLAATCYSAYLASLLVRAGKVCPLCIVLYLVNATILATGLVWWRRGVRRPALRPMLASGALVMVVGVGFAAASTPIVFTALASAAAQGERRPASASEAAVTPLKLPARVPSKGELDAGEVIEFSDLECPHCATLHSTVAQLAKDSPARVQVRLVNYPLDAECNPHVMRTLHPHACLLARGGICAQEQERFWQFVEVAFAHQESRSPTPARDVARRIGLDMHRFEACLDAEATTEALTQDIALAHEAGVRVTPTISVNGVMFKGAISRAQLLTVLDETAPDVVDRLPEDDTCATVAEDETE